MIKCDEISQSSPVRSGDINDELDTIKTLMGKQFEVVVQEIYSIHDKIQAILSKQSELEGRIIDMEASLSQDP